MTEEFSSDNRNIQYTEISCSFCNRAGHSVYGCNSSPLITFERFCDMFISDIPQSMTLSVIIREFKSFLIEEALHDRQLVKSFAMRKCNALDRDNIHICIAKIVNYYSANLTGRLLVPPISPFPQIYSETILSSSEDDTITLETEEETDNESDQEENVDSIINNVNINNSIADHLSESESIRLSYGILFLDMMRFIRNSNQSSQMPHKFDIKTHLLENEETVDERECNICYDQIENKNFIKFDCHHEFCKECVMNSLKNEERNMFCCAFCRKQVNNFGVRENSIKTDFDKYLTISRLREGIN